MGNLKYTREEVLSSVLDLIHHQGFHSTSLKELLNASGASSGSFYNYFKSKDKLASELIEYKWHQIKTGVIEPAKSLPDAIDGLFQLIHRLAEIHLAEPECGGCFLGNLIVELVEYDPSFHEHLKQVFDEWQGEILRFLQLGKSRLKPDIDIEFLAENILQQIEGVLLLSRLYKDPERMKRGFGAIAETLANSLL